MCYVYILKINIWFLFRQAFISSFFRCTFHKPELKYGSRFREGVHNKGFPHEGRKIKDYLRSTASLICNMLSLCYVYPDEDEKVHASIAEGERIRGFREALHLLDEKLLKEKEVVDEKVVVNEKIVIPVDVVMLRS